jgi:hypothetical protein
VQSIPETSPVAAAATELRGRIHARQVEELASAGQTALAAGELEDARARLAEARRIDATAAAVQALEVAIREHEEESGTAGRPEAAARRAGSSARREHRAARATQRRETPMRRETRRAEPPTRTEPPARTERPTRRETARGGSGVEDRVLALYRAGNFAGAAQAARQGADAASDSERRVLLGLEGRIRQFATAYQRAEAAGFSATAVRQMQQAVTLDDRISGGHYGRRIKPRLVAAYLGQARSALSRDQIGPGCAAVRSALAIDSSNRDARQLSSTCESRARQIFGRAQGMERSNSREAQNLYRQVQTMLPQGHPLGTQAYQRLNQLARRAGVDEDE